MVSPVMPMLGAPVGGLPGFPPEAAAGPPRRILLTTFGSLGDLNPSLALGQRLQARGHHVRLATSGFYRSRVEAAGLEFAPVPPDAPADLDDLGKTIFDKAMHPVRGSEYVVREMVLPQLRQTYAATLEAARDRDLLVSHLLTFALPIVAEVLGKPWVSTSIQPMVLFSAEDPPVMAQAPLLQYLRWAGPGPHRLAFRAVDQVMNQWFAPWADFRRELGLPVPHGNPMLAGQHAPELALGMFSRYFAPPRRDWPPQMVVTGFPFMPPAGDDTLAPELRDFLAAGPAPLVFTLGSSAVVNPGAFYAESAAAVTRLGMRAVFLGAPADLSLPAGTIAVPFAPHSAIFRHAAATIHQGGIGTTAEALRVGKPMVVVPFSHDQPDNAARVVKLGVGATISRRRYSAARLTAALTPLLTDDAVLARATTLGEQIRSEDGTGAAASALEGLCRRHELLAPSRPPVS